MVAERKEKKASLSATQPKQKNVSDEQVLFSSAATLVPNSESSLSDPSFSQEALLRTQGDSFYELLDLVGEGGMGAVYRAKDLPLHRIVAVKVLHDEVSKNVDMRRRFLKEAQITAQLEHPAIVPTYHIEETPEGQTRLAMRLIKGETLESFIKSELPRLGERIKQHHGLVDRLELFLRASDAVQYAHDKGVVHRDLKAENIMLGPFRDAYVMDWGLATLKGTEDSLLELERQPGRSVNDVEVVDDPRATRIGDVLGTVAYMAPEQAMGAHDYVSARSDQFALGLVLQELITLQPARLGESFRQVLVSAMQAKREPLPKWVPPELAAVVARAAHQDPEKRYANLREMATDIRRYLRGEELLAHPDSTFKKAWRLITKYKKAFAVAVVFLLLSTLSLITFNLFREAQREASTALMAQRVSEEVGLVTARALTLEGQANQVEYELAHLAGAVEHVLVLPPTASAAALSLADLAQPKALQSGTKRGYGFAISSTLPNIRLSDGSNSSMIDARRLSLLSEDFGKVWHGALNHNEEGQTTRSALAWAYVATPSGVMLSFPGRDMKKEALDPRKSAFYLNTIGTQGVRWSALHWDSLTQETVLSATRAVYSDKSQILGVLGLDLRFNTWKKLLPLLELEGFERAWLINDQNQVIADTSVPFTESAAKKRPELFSIGALVNERSISPASGEVEVGSARYLYARIPTLSLAYVVRKSIR